MSESIRVKVTREENARFYGIGIGDAVDVPLEDYVAGVVASEVGNAALQAACAQAIAARTYALAYTARGREIDDSSACQAFRAGRIDPVHYPNAISAAERTAGQVLCWQGRVLDTCVYSASNGGRTVSSEERWGGARPYLIAQDDPWDAAAGTGRNGHGVGMSQRGAKYAASIGLDYRRILAFYYPGAGIVCTREEDTDMDMTEDGAEEELPSADGGQEALPDRVVAAALAHLGDPYVYGAWGDPCTVALRRKYAGLNPEHADNISRACPVLSGDAEDCAGCKWQGALAYDCRGFVYWCLMQAGICISGGGATSQYNAAGNWMQRGTISSMPDVVCAVYKQVGSRMIHTGLHIGGGDIIHCSVGVQEGRITDKGWTHYAVPVGLYTVEQLAAAKEMSFIENLKRGSTGDEVRWLQEALGALGYSCGTADGIFGTKTEAAVRSFQAAQGLTVDGIAGVNTRAALVALTGDGGGEEEQLYTVVISGVTQSVVGRLREDYPQAVVTGM